MLPGELDASRFERLAADGNAALAADDAATAAQCLDRALGLWRGPALTDVDTVPAARAEVARLEEERLAALEMLAYRVLGQGGRDIVFVPGLMSRLELLWEDDQTSDFFRLRP